MYMPNNDLDAHGGDPDQVGSIRAKKVYRPRIFDGSTPIVYLWTFESEQPGLVELSEDLYQLGRGIDQAWARARWLSDEERAEAEGAYPGNIHRPAEGSGSTTVLNVATAGTLASLRARFAASEERIRAEKVGKKGFWAFRQPPKAALRTIAYDGSPQRRVFEFQSIHPERSSALESWSLAAVVELVERVRDGARDRLVAVLPQLEDLIDAHVVGRAAEPVSASLRVKIVPLPSIGHRHADPGIRRIMVEVPSGFGRLGVEDIFWGFSGLEVDDEFRLVSTAQDTMLRHYGVGQSARVWETVTPAALPRAPRRRIDPLVLKEERLRSASNRGEAKLGEERAEEEAAAIRQVHQALRHAGVRDKALHVRVQREPFFGKGRRAEAFERLPRFSKHGLWHVRVEFAQAVPGPLLLGDGRYLGLGVMSPARTSGGDYPRYVVQGLERRPQGEDLGRAFRRAMLSLAGESWGRDAIPEEISGHGSTGAPLAGHRHLRIAVHGSSVTLVPPHQGREHLERMATLLDGMTELRAGDLGLLEVTRVPPGTPNPLTATSTVWQSASRYRVCRHLKDSTVSETLSADVRAECRRARLPIPEVDVLETWASSKRGLEGYLRLRFPRPVSGPILLGKSAHLGGGTFLPDPET